MTAHIPEPIDNGALPSDRATQATPQAPSGLGHPVSVTSAAAGDFTPGPWNILGDDEGFDGVPYIEIAAGECGTHTFRPIAHVQPDYDDTRDDWTLNDTDYANAHLIAAAPDLLDALENLVIGIGMGWDLDGIIEASNAAIAKARGEA